MITSRRTIVLFILLTFFAADAYAGGPWALKKGKGRLTAGYSRKTAGSRWIEHQLEQNHDSTLVNGLFHDFRYGYITGEIGIIDNLELSATINYLWGYERVDGNPSLPGTQPIWEINEGFTDSWLNLKYQFLEGEYPMAVMLSTRSFRH